MASGLLAAAPGQVAHADSFMDQFRDTDGWFDMSDWVLNNAAGFMPVPIVITEPAVGEGLGLAALFFHAPKGYDQEDFEDVRTDFVDHFRIGQVVERFETSQMVQPDARQIVGPKRAHVGAGRLDVHDVDVFAEKRAVRALERNVAAAV